MTANLPAPQTAAQAFPRSPDGGMDVSRHRAILAGVRVTVSVIYDRGDRSVGIRPCYEAAIADDVVLVSAAEWAEEFPGTPPTVENMRALVNACADEIAERACEAAEEADAEICDEPDDFDDVGEDY